MVCPTQFPARQGGLIGSQPIIENGDYEKAHRLPLSRWGMCRALGPARLRLNTALGHDTLESVTPRASSIISSSSYQAIDYVSAWMTAWHSARRFHFYMRTVVRPDFPRTHRLRVMVAIPYIALRMGWGLRHHSRSSDRSAACTHRISYNTCDCTKPPQQPNWAGSSAPTTNASAWPCWPLWLWHPRSSTACLRFCQRTPHAASLGEALTR